MSQDQSFIMEKQLGWGGVLGDLQGGSNSVDHVRVQFRKRTMASACLD